MEDKNTNDQLRVGVVGVGPVGAVLVAHLLKAGAFVVPCDIIGKRMDKMRKSGLRLTHKMDMKVSVPQTCHTIQELEMFDLDLVIICSKTPGLKKVLGHIAEIMTDKMHVMCAQNGIDNELEVGRVFGDDKTLRMVVNYAGNMADDNIAHIAFFNPPNYLAAMSPKGEPMAQKIADLLKSAGLDTEIPEDILDFVWEKAILNASLSAVCAITRRTMKDVMDFPQTVELVEAIIDESVRVAEMEHIDLGKNFRRFCIRYLKNAGHHRPSMLIDLENDRPTEIDYLNGKIVKYGRKHSMPVPLNQALTSLVHLLEHSED